MWLSQDPLDDQFPVDYRGGDDQFPVDYPRSGEASAPAENASAP